VVSVSVCVFVCLLVTPVNPAELIEMLFGGTDTHGPKVNMGGWYIWVPVDEYN